MQLIHEVCEGKDTGAYHVLDCVILTLAEAAANLKTGLDAVAFEHKAFKAWEAKNASPTGEARP